MKNTLISDAVSSAHNLDWRTSACNDPRLQVPFTPAEIYNSNIALTMGNIMWVAPEARNRVADFLSRVDYQEVAESLRSDRPLPDLELSAAELESLHELTRESGFNKMMSARVVEEQFVADGYGQAAFAVLILVLAIAIAVVVAVYAF